MPRLASVLILFLLVPMGSAAQEYGTITTVVGGGPNHVSALSANLSSGSGIAIDQAGNLYISSLTKHSVYKVGPAGELVLVGGQNMSDLLASVYWLGDGGPATEANFWYPEGVAVDAGGNLFVADYQNNRIRRVDSTTGIITTVAGNGNWSLPGYAGDGGAATNAKLHNPFSIAFGPTGNLYFIDLSNLRIRKIVAGADGLVTGAADEIITAVAGDGTAGFAGDGGPATEAKFNRPHGVALDAAGNLFIADTQNHRIRRVDSATGTITTVAGNGTPGFAGDGGPATEAKLYNPYFVAMDSTGNLIIVDSTNRRIRRVDGVTGIITTVAGGGTGGSTGDGGPAMGASFNFLGGLAIDIAGNLYIRDAFYIRRVDTGSDGLVTGAADEIITTVAGNGFQGFSGDGGPAKKASLYLPRDVQIDFLGNLYVSDTNNQRIRRVDGVTGIITTVAGGGTGGSTGDGGPATQARLYAPWGVAVDSGGNLFIADYNNHRIRRVDSATGIITTVAGNGTAGFSGDYGSATEAKLYHPFNVAMDSTGNLFIADFRNNRVRRVDRVSGIITTVAGEGTEGFAGDGGPATAASLFLPNYLVFDAFGNLFIADSRNHRVRKVVAGLDGLITGTDDEIIVTVCGSGTPGSSGDGIPAKEARITLPRGLAFDAAGDLLLMEQPGAFGGRVRRVYAGIDGQLTGASDELITTVAGTGGYGFSGDGGPATEARFHGDGGLALDGAGNLFIADGLSDRIRRVVLNHPPVADAGPDQTVILGEQALFNGTESYDPDGWIESYQWDANGGMVFGATVGYTFNSSGDFTVTLTVTDEAGLSATDTLTVTVLTTTQTIQKIMDLVKSFNLQQGILNSLDAKLQNARDALDAANAGKREDAANKLRALVAAVEAQRGKELTTEQADELTSWVIRLLAVI